MGRKDSIEKRKKKEAQRRILRSKYLQIRSRIHGCRDVIAESAKKFVGIVNEVENLHQYVKKPREHALSSILVDSAKAHTTGGITPSDFISSLFRHFGVQNQPWLSGNGANLLVWKDIGFDVAHIFKNGKGCFTMTGPMNIQVKQRKLAVGRRKRTFLSARAQPEKVNNNAGVLQTVTEQNIYIMLRQKHPVKLEHVILNRHSFSKTVENLFALSFLVKDGEVSISVDQTGCHLISPKNPPASREVNSQFIFRLDFSDWKKMVGVVAEGEELMPHKKSFNPSVPAESTLLRYISETYWAKIRHQKMVVQAPSARELFTAKEFLEPSSPNGSSFFWVVDFGH